MAVADSPKPEHYAFVVGCNEYQHTRVLDNAVNDATKVAEMLQRTDLHYYYKVTTLLNCTRAEFMSAFIAFAKQLESREPSTVKILIFYAGHGFELNGRSMLCPVDVNPKDIDKLIPLDQMMDFVMNRNPLFCAALLDCCRSTITRAEKQKMQKEDASKTRGPSSSIGSHQDQYIAFSTSPGSTAEDGLGTNGLFTTVLLKNMETTFVPLEAMMAQICKDMFEAHHKKQVPWRASSLTDADVYLQDNEEGIPWNKLRREIDELHSSVMSSTQQMEENFNDLKSQAYKPNPELDQLLAEVAAITKDGH